MFLITIRWRFIELLSRETIPRLLAKGATRTTRDTRRFPPPRITLPATRCTRCSADGISRSHSTICNVVNRARVQMLAQRKPRCELHTRLGHFVTDGVFHAMHVRTCTLLASGQKSGNLNLKGKTGSRAERSNKTRSIFVSSRG